MFIPGLVSITFRELSPEELIKLCVDNGLRSIEWGGDVHVPHGDVETAQKVGDLTRAAGLSISAYGTYYRYDDCDPESNAEGPAFSDALSSAVALGSPVLRVWAGRRGSSDASKDWETAFAQQTRKMADLCDEQGIKLALEYHGNTMNDTGEASVALFKSIDHPNLFTYWQPLMNIDDQTRMDDLRMMLPNLLNIHCFHWGPGGWQDRLSLKEGHELWKSFLELASTDSMNRHVSLEYVKDDKLENFINDARTLSDICN